MTTITNHLKVENAEDQHNARFIIRACNNHDALVDLLDRIVGSMSLERVERFDLNNEAKELLEKIKP